MKKSMYIVGVAFALTLSAFSPDENRVSGTYGVCSHSGMVELEIMPDGTYHYIDRSDQKAPVDVNGTWEARKNRVLLKDNENLRFHRKWHISSDGTIAKSRKGMAFYRLVNKDKCR